MTIQTKRLLRDLPPLCWMRNSVRRRIGRIGPGLWLTNVIVQRLLRVNGHLPWMVHYTSTVGRFIEIGRNVEKSFAVSGGCYFQTINGITIGDDTIFAPGVKVISANHCPGNLSTWEKTGRVVIGKNCWLGAGAIILPGVTLGDNAIVGAGAVVTKSVDANTCVVGNPARVLRRSEA